MIYPGIKNVSIEIIGLVQGVGFRYFTTRKANELKINGFVKNEGDNKVIIEAEGEKNNLEKFIETCKKGYGNSKVEKINVLWNNEIHKYKKFNIIH